MTETPISSTEAGLLTVAERRGLVSAPLQIDERNDPIARERRAILQRLETVGLLRRESGGEGEAAYAITDLGRAALADLDSRRRPRKG